MDNDSTTVDRAGVPSLSLAEQASSTSQDACSGRGESAGGLDKRTSGPLAMSGALLFEYGVPVDTAAAPGRPIDHLLVPAHPLGDTPPAHVDAAWWRRDESAGDIFQNPGAGTRGFDKSHSDPFAADSTAPARTTAGYAGTPWSTEDDALALLAGICRPFHMATERWKFLRILAGFNRPRSLGAIERRISLLSSKFADKNLLAAGIRPSGRLKAGECTLPGYIPCYRSASHSSSVLSEEYNKRWQDELCQDLETNGVTAEEIALPVTEEDKMLLSFAFRRNINDPEELEAIAKLMGALWYPDLVYQQLTEWRAKSIKFFGLHGFEYTSSGPQHTARSDARQESTAQNTQPLDGNLLALSDAGAPSLQEGQCDSQGRYDQHDRPDGEQVYWDDCLKPSQQACCQQEHQQNPWQAYQQGLSHSQNSQQDMRQQSTTGGTSAPEETAVRGGKRPASNLGGSERIETEPAKPSFGFSFFDDEVGRMQVDRVQDPLNGAFEFSYWEA